MKAKVTMITIIKMHTCMIAKKFVSDNDVTFQDIRNFDGGLYSIDDDGSEYGNSIVMYEDQYLNVGSDSENLYEDPRYQNQSDREYDDTSYENTHNDYGNKKVCYNEGYYCTENSDDEHSYSDTYYVMNAVRIINGSSYSQDNRRNRNHKLVDSRPFLSKKDYEDSDDEYDEVLNESTRRRTKYIQNNKDYSKSKGFHSNNSCVEKVPEKHRIAKQRIRKRSSNYIW